MSNYHGKIERNSILMLVLVIIVISIGGLVEIVPLFRMETTIEPVKGVRPYTALELAGQNIYVREGCNVCHSQQIRPLRDEVERYGHYSLAAESMYDHPFVWGSKRTGPDLARVGGKYSDDWHVQHLKNPRNVVPESIMPSYAFLAKRGVKVDDLPEHMQALKAVGVPYTDKMIENAVLHAKAQARNDSEYHDEMREEYGEKVNLRDFDGKQEFLSELDALVAYLQVLGTMAELKSYDADLNSQEEAK